MTARSVAICGKQRIRHPHHRLAGKGRQRQQQDRAVGRWRGDEVGHGKPARADDSARMLTLQGPAGFLARRRRAPKPEILIRMIDKTYQPSDVGAAHLAGLGTGAGVPRRPARSRRCEALLHRHSAAERHRLAAYGPCAQQYPAGHPVPLRAHARQGRAVAARHRPCRHRHPDGGRAPVDGAPGARPPRHGPREVPRAGLGVEGRIGRHHHQPAQAARRLLRLVARALHHGRGPVAGRAQGVRRALPRRADLQGQAAGQLGPEAAHRDLRPRSAAGRGQGQPLASPLSDRGRDFDPDDPSTSSSSPPRGRRPCWATPRSRCIRTTRATGT